MFIVQETLADNIANPENWGYTYNLGYKHLGAGLAVGLSSMASGLTIGLCGEAGVYGMKHTDILIAIILMMIFAECIALYGFIVAIVLSSG